MIYINEDDYCGGGDVVDVNDFCDGDDDDDGDGVDDDDDFCGDHGDDGHNDDDDDGHDSRLHFPVYVSYCAAQPAMDRRLKQLRCLDNADNDNDKDNDNSNNNNTNDNGNNDAMDR